MEFSNSERCCTTILAKCGAEVAAGAFLEMTKFISCWTRLAVSCGVQFKLEAALCVTGRALGAEVRYADEEEPWEPAEDPGGAREVAFRWPGGNSCNRWHCSCQ